MRQVGRAHAHSHAARARDGLRTELKTNGTNRSREKSDTWIEKDSARCSWISGLAYQNRELDRGEPGAEELKMNGCQHGCGACLRAEPSICSKCLKRKDCRARWRAAWLEGRKKGKDGKWAQWLRKQGEEGGWNCKAGAEKQQGGRKSVGRAQQRRKRTMALLDRRHTGARA